jgi:hypothetical protein
MSFPNKGPRPEWPIAGAAERRASEDAEAAKRHEDSEQREERGDRRRLLQIDMRLLGSGHQDHEE